MKITTVNNAELVIQAKNEAEFEIVRKVAQQIQSDSNDEVVVCSEDEYELWVHLTTVWSHYQAKDLKDMYMVAKKAA